VVLTEGWHQTPQRERDRGRPTTAQLGVPRRTPDVPSTQRRGRTRRSSAGRAVGQRCGASLCLRRMSMAPHDGGQVRHPRRSRVMALTMMVSYRCASTTLVSRTPVDERLIRAARTSPQARWSSLSLTWLWGDGASSWLTRPGSALIQTFCRAIPTQPLLGTTRT